MGCLGRDHGLESLVLTLALHRSRGGPDREISVGKVRLCRRCSFLTAGLFLGAAVFLVVPPSLWLIVLVNPLLADLVAEKVLGLGHRPAMVAVTSLLGGIALGGAVVAAVQVGGVLTVGVALTVIAYVVRDRRRR